MDAEPAESGDSARRKRGLLTARDEAARRLLDDRRVPGLPVDGDPAELRHPPPNLAKTFRAIADELLVERNPFFDRVRADWRKLFPDLPAEPGRWSEGRLFLYVTSAGRLFALRRKLPSIRRTLAAVEGAPAKFSVHLEIHAAPARR